MRFVSARAEAALGFSVLTVCGAVALAIGLRTGPETEDPLVTVPLFCGVAFLAAWGARSDMRRAAPPPSGPALIESPVRELGLLLPLVVLLILLALATGDGDMGVLYMALGVWRLSDYLWLRRLEVRTGEVLLRVKGFGKRRFVVTWKRPKGGLRPT